MKYWLIRKLLGRREGHLNASALRLFENELQQCLRDPALTEDEHKAYFMEYIQVGHLIERLG
jgi:hypothetical protein